MRKLKGSEAAAHYKWKLPLNIVECMSNVQHQRQTKKKYSAAICWMWESFKDIFCDRSSFMPLVRPKRELNQCTESVLCACWMRLMILRLHCGCGQLRNWHQGRTCSCSWLWLQCSQKVNCKHDLVCLMLSCFARALSKYGQRLALCLRAFGVKDAAHFIM